MAEANPTINDVARLAGVSKKTVSRVINRSPLLSDHMRRRVESVIRDLGFIPNPQARGLALQRNFLIGLIHDSPNAQMVLGVEQGILEAIRDTEFALVVRPVDRGSPTMLDDVRKFLECHRLFGVLLLPPISEDDALADLCRSLGCRYVRMGSAMLDDADHSVASNDAEVVAEATAISDRAGPSPHRPHRRPAQLPLGAEERRRGFEAALAEAGIKLPRGLIASGDYRFESGVEAGNRLLDQVPMPTAIFSCNDEWPPASFSAARQRNLAVPQDLVGHRLRRYRHCRPCLAAADHGALADRVDGALGGAQAAGRHACR